VLSLRAIFYASCLRFGTKSCILSFTKGRLWHLSNRNLDGIKKRGIEVLNHKHPFPMSDCILCDWHRL
jgi:hypothetical protein